MGTIRPNFRVLGFFVTGFVVAVIGVWLLSGVQAGAAGGRGGKKSPLPAAGTPVQVLGTLTTAKSCQPIWAGGSKGEGRFYDSIELFGKEGPPVIQTGGRPTVTLHASFKNPNLQGAKADQLSDTLAEILFDTEGSRIYGGWQTISVGVGSTPTQWIPPGSKIGTFTPAASYVPYLYICANGFFNGTVIHYLVTGHEI